MINQDLKVRELLETIQQAKSKMVAACKKDHEYTYVDILEKIPTLERITLTYNTRTAEVRANFSVNFNVGITL